MVNERGFVFDGDVHNLDWKHIAAKSSGFHKILQLVFGNTGAVSLPFLVPPPKKSHREKIAVHKNETQIIFQTNIFV